MALFTLSFVTVLGLAGCSKPSPTSPDPGPEPDPGLTIACPAAVTAETDQAGAVVNYPVPVTTGGVAPVTVACSVPSGSTFQAGTSFVSCYATDEAARTTQCSFQITVKIVPKLKGVKFLAFGDSITSGEIGDPVTALRIQVFRPEDSYPSLLQTRLQDRYRLQTTVMTNAGLGGEFAVCLPDRPTCSTTRLSSEIRTQHPDAVLLMQGANDLNSQIAPELVSDALRANVRQAHADGVSAVFISTMTPQVPPRFRAFAAPGAIELLNSYIRGWAPAEQAFLVDSYAAMDPNKETLIGSDGLHTTLAGNQVIADTFLAAISANFELPPPIVPPPAAAPGAAIGTRLPGR